MRYDTRYRSRSSLLFSSFPSGVKWLLISNIAVYLVYFFGSWLRGEPIFQSLLLMPIAVLHGQIWQLGTYLFLHSLGSVWHILFNMLSLWMFGTPIEQTWGTKRFLQYYFICGIGAGICVVVANLAFGDPYQRVLGASGAIYGLLLAYGMLFPNQTVLMSFLFPIKAKYMVMIFGAIAFLSSFQGGGTVSNLAHLGGMLFGFIYMKTQFASSRTVSYGGTYPRGTFTAAPKAKGPRVSFNLGQWWREYKLQRARKKFKVYMKEHDEGRGPWTN
jgi:membrane associated rhomboid family serine protease